MAALTVQEPRRRWREAALKLFLVLKKAAPAGGILKGYIDVFFVY